MNVFEYKLLTKVMALIALIILAPILLIMTKEKYNKYDLNRDGIVDEQDLEEMQEYLCKE